MLMSDVRRMAEALVDNGVTTQGAACVVVVIGGTPTGRPIDDVSKVIVDMEARSCERLAALYIAMTAGIGLPIDTDAMLRALQTAFPDRKVGARHPPFYLSRARTGQLVGLPPGMVLPEIPNIPRKPKVIASTEPKPRATPKPKISTPLPEPLPPTDDPAAMTRDELIEWLKARNQSTEGRPVELIRRALGLVNGSAVA